MMIRHVTAAIIAVFSLLALIATTLQNICFVEELLSKTSAIRSGATAVAGFTRQQYIDRLTWLKALMRYNLSNFNDRKGFERICNVLELLKLDNSNGSIRKQPYCVVLTGLPGCGKSNYALQIAASCLRARYGTVVPEDIVTLNETDEFQSEFRSYHKVVIFDDVGAEKASLNGINPWRKVMDFVNNIRKTSLNPNVEMKGNVYIEPDLVIITTNLKPGFDVHHYMNAPGAILRRMKKILILSPGFEKAKDFTVKQSNGMQYNAFDYGSMAFSNADSCPERDRKELLDEITMSFCDHLHEQQLFIDTSNSVFDLVPQKSALRAFFDDVIYTHLPVKVPLEKYQEDELPFLNRMFRKFCRNGNMLVAQSGCEPLPTELFEQQALQNSIGSFSYSLDDDTILDCQSLDVDISEDKRQALKRLVNWDLFAVMRERLAKHRILCIYKDGFAKDATSQPFTHLFEAKVHSEAPVATFQLLNELYEEMLDKKIESEPESEIDTVRTLWIYSYRTSKETFVVTDLDSVVEKLTLDLADMSLGKLKADSMAVVQHALASRAEYRKIKCLGVEFPLYGMTPDVVLRSGDFNIVVECKNTRNVIGKKQLIKYLRTLKENRMLAIGVLYTQREIKLYTLEEEVPSGLLGNLKLLLLDTLDVLRTKSEYYGTTHFENLDRCGAVGPCEEVEHKLSR